MKYAEYADNPASFKALTGTTIEIFNKILPYFEDEHDLYLRYRQMDGSPRKGVRRASLYRNSPLPTIEDRLFFILVYFKHNPTQEYHAGCFSMTQKQCNVFVHGLTDIVEKTLESAGVAPCRNMREFTARLVEMGAQKSSMVLLHDGTERPIPRPQDPDEQKENYSGKKKRHTVKNGVVCTLSTLILLVTATVAGTVHDKRIADQSYSFPFSCKLLQDTGYQGYAPANAHVCQPAKKPRGGELSEEQKRRNREISKVRVRVEHAIGGAKRFRIARDVCRLRANDFVGRIFHIPDGLHNLRVTVAA